MAQQDQKEESVKDQKISYPLICDESVMSQKKNGTTEDPIQEKLRWGCDAKTAKNICCYNRHYAEYSGYWETTSFLKEQSDKVTKFYDTVSGKLLFEAPKGRTFDAFKKESEAHGWPSLRDAEVNWENVRCLKNGECVSLVGTHLGYKYIYLHVHLHTLFAFLIYMS